MQIGDQMRNTVTSLENHKEDLKLKIEMLIEMKWYEHFSRRSTVAANCDTAETQIEMRDGTVEPFPASSRWPR